MTNKAKTELARDRDTGNDRAAAELKKNAGVDVDPGPGEIVQTKPTLGEALAGEGKGLAGVGAGSYEETAPKVSGSLESKASQRVVQQGDEVMLHTRSTFNGTTVNRGLVLKVNQDGTIAVRIPSDLTGTRDFSPVYNQPQNGEDWWSWPEKQGVLDKATDAD